MIFQTKALTGTERIISVGAGEAGRIGLVRDTRLVLGVCRGMTAFCERAGEVVIMIESLEEAVEVNNL